MGFLDGIKGLVPGRVRGMVRDILGITALQGRITRLETLVYESSEEAWERSRTRWRTTKPTLDLTWGEEVTGDAFIDKVTQYGGFDAHRDVLEIGPGYGRLLGAVLKRRCLFRSYLGIDIASRNIEYLESRFANERVRFQQGDVETVELGSDFDVLISSLTFKHFFPSFSKALTNVGRRLRPGALVIFDLVEGDRACFEADNVTFVRQYRRVEILKILEEAGLKHLGFDEVQHSIKQVRLLVVAKKIP
jgi:SAM-dependent methyltransferase